MTTTTTPETTTSKTAEAFKNEIRKSLEFVKTLSTDEILWAEERIDEYKVERKNMSQSYDEATGWDHDIASEILHGDGSEYEVCFHNRLESLACDFDEEDNIPDACSDEFEELYDEIRAIFNDARVEQLITTINRLSQKRRDYVISRIS